ncbi:MAG: NUDIX hydrolase [Planctomycetaceae bacterium]|jgi:ADP-ribose pyrophosphatase YjhB (NUDIX family)|nr:NUDIX hydrolase [Planctomycetaceae bacterium]
MTTQSEAEFLKTYDASKYPRPSVTVDMVIFTIIDRKQPNRRKLPEKDLKVLLIKRGGHPFKDCWALPGGFVRQTESIDAAACRELSEETGLANVYMEQLYTWGEPQRDPRTRVISCSYMALIDAGKITLQAGDDAVDAKWFTVKKILKRDKRTLTKTGFVQKQKFVLSLVADDTSLETQLEKTITIAGKVRTEDEQIIVPGQLAFDHARMISYALDRMRNKIEYTDIAFNLLPEFFTLTQLQQVYETILGHELLKANFRRKIEDKVIETDQFTEVTGHRPSRLYKFLSKD